MSLCVRYAIKRTNKFISEISVNFRLTTPPDLKVQDIKWLAVYTINNNEGEGYYFSPMDAKLIFPSNTVAV